MDRHDAERALASICDHIAAYRDAAGITTTEALEAVLARYGEKLQQPDTQAQLRAAADELGIELP